MSAILSGVAIGKAVKWFVIIILIISAIKFILACFDTEERQNKRAAKADEKFRQQQEKLNRELKKAGNDYETEAAKNLSKILGEPLRTVIMPHRNGNDTEADIIFVDKKGVWVIECKEHGRLRNDNNDSFMINGRTQGDDWIVCPPGGDHFTMKNPLKQNSHHCEAVEDILINAGIRPVVRSLVVTNCHFSMMDFGRMVNDTDRMGFYDMRDGEGLLRIGEGSKWKKTFSRWHDDQQDFFTDTDVMRVKIELVKFVADENQRAIHDVVAAEHTKEYENR